MQAMKYKALHTWAVNRLESKEGCHRLELARARQREVRLQGEPDAALAQVRDLRQRVCREKTQAVAQHAGIDAFEP